MNESWRRYIRFWGARVDADVDDELAFHVEMRVLDYIERGMTERDARAAATQRLGDIRRTRQACLTIGHRRQRRMTRAQTLDAFVQDVQYALRTLGRQKAWTAVALITLALGIGASTAMFSVVNSLVLNPLPYPGADRVATVWRSDPKAGVMITPRFNMVDAWEKNARSFEAFEPYAWREVTLTGLGDAAPLMATSVKPDFPRFTGAPLIAGRTFLPEELLPGSRRVAIVSEALWRERLGAAPSAVGRTVMLDDKKYTIVGVASSRMRLPEIAQKRTDFWLPLISDTLGYGRHLAIRVRQGISFQTAAAELDSILARTGLRDKFGTKDYVAQLMRPTEFLGFKSSLYLLSVAVALLLIVACANVAHLLLARGATRARELAIRTALGAGRRRLMRQLLTESLLLAGVGGVLGIGVAIFGLKLLLLFRPERLSELSASTIDATALWAAVALSVLTGIAFGLTAAIDAVRRTTSESLRNTAIAGTATRHTHRLRSVLVVTEMALSALLVVGAALLVRSVIRLHGIDPGFDTAGLYTLHMDLPDSRYPDAAAKRAFIDRLFLGAKAIPGVVAVAKTHSTPPDAGFMMTGMEAEGALANTPVPGPLAENTVAPDYFSTIGAPLAEGSAFGPTAGARKEVMINHSLATKLWPGQSALGRRIRYAKNGDKDSPWMTVVGVVTDLPTFALKGDRTRPMIYFPIDEKDAWPEATLAVRMKPGDDPTTGLRQIVKTLDARLPPPAVKTVAAALEETIATESFTMVLLAVFASLAVVLSAVGLYGVISYVVTQRTREIGIRVALGATPRHVATSIVARGLVLSTIGLALGLTAAVWGTKLLTTTLYGVTGTDAASYVTTGALLTLISVLACLLPMSRALSVDPVIAMRGD